MAFFTSHFCLFPCDKFVFMLSDILCQKRKALEKPLWHLKVRMGEEVLKSFVESKRKEKERTFKAGLHDRFF